MTLARVHSIGFLGLDAVTIDVELDLYGGGSDKLQMVLVGLPDSAVRESKDRVVAAVRNTGHAVDACRITVNL
ncbi:MAG: hypothetical protein KDK78_05265, partial [Chlamydiia bacterium]|nr:hypothetical protein [Chlamydiia bacterium]